MSRYKWKALLCIFVVAFLILPAVNACTIFVLVDSNHALFCNNEDWSNPKTRIWFVPSGQDFYGCVYVGFDNGFAQGGLNTQGLAFDWVAGYMETWEPDPKMKNARGNPSERMLETCATVEDAISFYRKYKEPDFSRAKILVADRTGASVIIGARKGRLQIERAKQCRGFGYGSRILNQMMAEVPEPIVSSGARMLQACVQKGQYATKYSNVFDLKSGGIYLYLFPEQTDAVKLDLTTELKKGGHYYDIPQIRQQLTQDPMPLLNNMKRFFLDGFKPIQDNEPHLTAHIRKLIEDAAGGSMRADDYTAEFWQGISPQQKEVKADLKRLGNIISIALVDRNKEDARRSYRYLVEFENARMLFLFVLEEQNKVVFFVSEGSERKSDTDTSSK